MKMLGILNVEEMFYGFGFGLMGAQFIGWWAVPVAVLCAFSWALGGAPNQSAAWRRVGCPLILVGVTALITQVSPWFLLTVLPLFGILSMGYGIPTEAPGRPDNDEGSALGRFFWRLTNKTELLTDIYVRTLIMSLLVINYFGGYFIVKGIVK